MAQNFLTSLGKGFVRSAVNQVGRDGGRVVSNNIYGDAHSIPHRNVNAAYYNQPVQQVFGQTPVTESAIFVDTPTIKNYLLWALLVIITYGGGFIALFLRGLYVYNKKTISCFKYITKTNEVRYSDRRYNVGYRSEYYNQISKQKFELPIDQATLDQIAKQKKWSKIYMIIGGIPIAIVIVIFIVGLFIGLLGTLI